MIPQFSKSDPLEILYSGNRGTKCESEKIMLKRYKLNSTINGSYIRWTSLAIVGVLLENHEKTKYRCTDK